ncbi:hypothetical protein Daesc_008085 [Daldinia eschscholtzii]|uniref:Uncharacterized protein n=1 Tax=Daldinia eschscholtzii TaxID=292717 RepID=A0AAX6MBC3_9PEZI
MIGCFPKLSFRRSKKSAQEQAVNVADAPRPRDISVDSNMSKPDKYKGPSEKGTAVPITTSNSGWKPYTVPYNDAGVQRSASGTNWAALTPGKHESFAVPSHAAPPLYITGDQKKKAPEGAQMFKGIYVVSRTRPEDRTPIE